VTACAVPADEVLNISSVVTVPGLFNLIGDVGFLTFHCSSGGEHRSVLKQ